MITEKKSKEEGEEGIEQRAEHELAIFPSYKTDLVSENTCAENNTFLPCSTLAKHTHR